MSKTLLLSAPVDGTNAYVALSIVGHDHKIAAMLNHDPGTGRWIDRYEVFVSGDHRLAKHDGEALIRTRRGVFDTLAEAREWASGLYRDAADRAAAHRWAEAEAAVAIFHPDQDINGR